MDWGADVSVLLKGVTYIISKPSDRRRAEVTETTLTKTFAQTTTYKCTSCVQQVQAADAYRQDRQDQQNQVCLDFQRDQQDQ